MLTQADLPDDIDALRALVLEQSRMLAEERRNLMVQALEAAGMMSTEDLARQLGVSAETVRRDLVKLEQGGQIRRVHGGASRASGFRGTEATFSERAEAGAAAKQRIAALAAALVRPGQTLSFDVGTTALAVAKALPADYHGTVVTCSLLDAEGADRAATFLQRHPDWRAESPDLPAGEARGAGWRLAPGRDGTDGFFIARFVSP